MPSILSLITGVWPFQTEPEMTTSSVSVGRHYAELRAFNASACGPCIDRNFTVWHIRLICPHHLTFILSLYLRSVDWVWMRYSLRRTCNTGLSAVTGARTFVRRQLFKALKNSREIPSQLAWLFSPWGVLKNFHIVLWHKRLGNNLMTLYINRIELICILLHSVVTTARWEPVDYCFPSGLTDASFQYPKIQTGHGKTQKEYFTNLGQENWK